MSPHSSHLDAGSSTLGRPSLPSRASSSNSSQLSSSSSSGHPSSLPHVPPPAPPGTSSNRPPPLTLDTSSPSLHHPQPSIGRSTDIELQGGRSSSPIQRYGSPTSTSASFLNHTTPTTTHHHSLRQSHTPQPHSPPHVSEQRANERPSLVSFHSHLHPLEPPTFLGRQLAKFRDPQTNRFIVPTGLTPWMPLLAWGGSSLGFVLAFTFWRKELFEGLDSLAVTLAAEGLQGQIIMGFLIFLTTIPPLPLYSSLIILSGYAFGATVGFVVSYVAALSGAVIVFLLSRYYLRAQMIKLLSRSPSMARVVHAIERKPSLLFLIRLAPYPYNVMNTLLASSRTLTLTTYTSITALSLLKIIIHTTIGASIKNWSSYHDSDDKPIVLGPNGAPLPLTPEEQQEEDDAARGEMLRKTWSVVGIGLCVLLFIYLTIVARRAVDQTEPNGSNPSSPVAAGAYTRLPTHDTREGYEVEGAAEMRELEVVVDEGRAKVGSGIGRVISGGGRDGVRMSISGLEDVVGFGTRGGG